MSVIVVGYEGLDIGTRTYEIREQLKQVRQVSASQVVVYVGGRMRSFSLKGTDIGFDRVVELDDFNNYFFQELDGHPHVALVVNSDETEFYKNMLGLDEVSVIKTDTSPARSIRGKSPWSYLTFSVGSYTSD
jgi:hypothetical protein